MAWLPGFSSLLAAVASRSRRRAVFHGEAGTSPRLSAERTATRCIDESGRYRLDVGFNRAGVTHDSGARILLRGAGPPEERAQYDDDELHLARIRRDSVGGVRLLARLHRGEQLPRRHVERVPARR